MSGAFIPLNVNCDTAQNRQKIKSTLEQSLA